jgi:hypothetical protein
MVEDTTYSKKSTGASPYFGGGTPPKGVYMENPGRINTPRDIPSGGEVRRSSIVERGGAQLRPNYENLRGTVK